MTPWERGLPATVSGEAFTDVLRYFIPLLSFDQGWYCRRYPDFAATVNCRVIATGHGHFFEYGFSEGRSPAPPTAALPAADRVSA